MRASEYCQGSEKFKCTPDAVSGLNKQRALRCTQDTFPLYVDVILMKKTHVSLKVLPILWNFVIMYVFPSVVLKSVCVCTGVCAFFFLTLNFFQVCLF